MIKDKKFNHPILTFLGLILFFIGIGVFVYAQFDISASRFNTMMWGVIIVFASNIIYAMSDFKKYYIFLFFHIALFTFLIVNPFVLMLRDIKWWEYYTLESETMSLIALLITMIAMRIGAIFGLGIVDRVEAGEAKRFLRRDALGKKSLLRDEEFLKNLRLVSGIVFIIAFVCGALVGYEKLTFMDGKSYEDFYILYKSELPGIIKTISDCTKYIVCLYLASKPSKKMTLLVFIPYILLALPDFIIGARNPVILRMMLLAIYYIYRHYEGPEKWIKKFEKFVIIVVVPFAIAFLGYYTHMRADENVKMNIFEAVVDFFMVLGASYSFMCAAFMLMPKITKRSVSFIVGPAYEYIFHGTFAQALFGAIALGNVNSELKALEGWNFSHTFSYYYDTSGYLSGHGYGTSYLLETYADLGWIGVILFSLLLGVILIYLTKMLRSNALSRTIALVALLGLFFIPRAEATDWITFLVYIQFWAITLVILFASALLYRKYNFKNIGFENIKEERRIGLMR